MISKELFKEIMIDEDIDLEYVIELYPLKNSIRYWIIENPKYQSTSKYINIHELAYKCKEWAFTKGFQIQVYKSSSYNYMIFKKGNFYLNMDFPNQRCIKNSTAFETDVESMISACEWILNETN